VSTPIRVRTISAAEHRAWVSAQPSLSFLQTPAWGRVKAEWRAESVGWFEGDALQAAALVLYRKVPKVAKHLAYLPEGPALEWSSPRIVEYLAALRTHLKAQGAFAIRLGPTVVSNRWHADTIKAAIADPTVARLADVPPDVREPLGPQVAATLATLGFSHQSADDGGFATGQPQFVFQVPLAGRTEADLLAGMNQLWRRNIKKSAKLGVEVTRGGVDDLAAFHAIYLETAERDRFTPRPLPYFELMMRELLAEDPDRMRLYLAHHEGDLVASTLWIRVGRHTWYSYGASTAAKREVQGSTAIQWQMMRDALAAGAAVYDLRGITETLREDDPHIGLMRFKVGTGGEAVEYVGEWDYPMPGTDRLLYRAFDLYMRRRGG
jgi:lipid II:glycine glycyltransferase (peptidoglycan interpeptide bridge formation enzyme)